MPPDCGTRKTNTSNHAEVYAVRLCHVSFLFTRFEYLSESTLTTSYSQLAFSLLREHKNDTDMRVAFLQSSVVEKPSFMLRYTLRMIPGKRGFNPNTLCLWRPNKESSLEQLLAGDVNNTARRLCRPSPRPFRTNPIFSSDRRNVNGTSGREIENSGFSLPSKNRGERPFGAHRLVGRIQKQSVLTAEADGEF